jgi:type IX secretion system substrate protein
LLFRLDESGANDTDFGNGGFVQKDFGGVDEIMAVALQADQKIVVAGRSQVLPDGSLYSFMLGRYFSGLGVAVEETCFQSNETLVFPNPISSNSLNLDLERFTGEIDFILFNGLGEVVFKKMNVNSNLGRNLEFQLPGNLSKGLYTLRIYTESKQFSEKIIVL